MTTKYLVAHVIFCGHSTHRERPVKLSNFPIDLLLALSVGAHRDVQPLPIICLKALYTAHD